jgi:hypothetical protein
MSKVKDAIVEKVARKSLDGAIICTPDGKLGILSTD